ncbi:hypothetical protein EV363DRAFT_1567580 [Boletus edulis]|nr:hypothetical protein EV363DRAFT_1567580 [Boletus edulis]
MNRPGQPPQRPPSLAPPASLSSQFRSPYPTSQFPIQQRTYPAPTLQQQNPHRTPAVPQSPFLQRQQPQSATFPFAPGAAILAQNGGSSLPPHMSPNPPAATPTSAPSASSTSEVGFDLNEFPALGSLGQSNTSNTSSNNNVPTSLASTALTSSASNPSASNATSYAIQVGQGGSSAAAPGPQPRDLGPEDFPALGGQQSQQTLPSQCQPQSQHQPQPSENHSLAHPPGLNGFNDHRSSMLGSLNGAQQPNANNLPSSTLAGTQQSGTPGMLNLRGVHPGFQNQGDAEKQRQNYALKLNQVSHAAWNAPNTNLPPSQPNGSAAASQTQSHSQLQPQPLVQGQPGQLQSTLTQPSSQGQQAHTSNNPQSQTQPSQHLNPPGVPPPGVGPLHSSLAQAQNQPHHHPQTPAQQVLISAADRWGLLGLLAMIKNASVDADGGLSSVGTDLGAVGLDMGYEGNLYSTFITPWADQSAARSVEPDFHLPSCYNVQPPPPGPSKAGAFSDETLFYMFYSSPRDALQEIAAQELYNRNWRYHKELRVWITKESGSAPSTKIPGGEAGTYTWWDPESWTKERKEMTVRYADLEEKNVAAFVMGPGLVLNQAAQTAQGQQAPGTIGSQVPNQPAGQPRMQMAGI